MESMDSHSTHDAAASRHPFVERGLRRLSSVTLAAGLASAGASVGIVLLNRDPGYVRALLASRDWGTAEPTAADVAAAQSSVPDAVLAGVALLAVTALLLWQGCIAMGTAAIRSSWIRRYSLSERPSASARRRRISAVSGRTSRTWSVLIPPR